MKRKHDTDSPLCWCRPKLQKTCPSCEGNADEFTLHGIVPCWRCKGYGLVEAGPHDSDPLVIHNDVEEEAEYSQPMSGPSWVVILVLICLCILLAAGYLAMGAYGGGGR